MNIEIILTCNEVFYGMPLRTKMSFDFTIKIYFDLIRVIFPQWHFIVSCIALQ